MAEKFIKVKKDDEVIEIHPLTLDDHKRLGWKVVGEESEAATVLAPDGGAAEKKSNVRKRVAKGKAEEGNTEA